jgi:hypothetical protein
MNKYIFILRDAEGGSVRFESDMQKYLAEIKAGGIPDSSLLGSTNQIGLTEVPEYLISYGEYKRSGYGNQISTHYGWKEEPGEGVPNVNEIRAWIIRNVLLEHLFIKIDPLTELPFLDQNGDPVKDYIPYTPETFDYKVLSTKQYFNTYPDLDGVVDPYYSGARYEQASSWLRLRIEEAMLENANAIVVSDMLVKNSDVEYIRDRCRKDDYQVVVMRTSLFTPLWHYDQVKKKFELDIANDNPQKTLQPLKRTESLLGGRIWEITDGPSVKKIKTTIDLMQEGNIANDHFSNADIIELDNRYENYPGEMYIPIPAPSKLQDKPSIVV